MSVYGLLSGKLTANIDIAKLIFKTRNLNGFHLSNFLTSLTMEEMMKFSKDYELIAKNFHELKFEDKLFKTSEVK